MTHATSIRGRDARDGRDGRGARAADAHVEIRRATTDDLSVVVRLRLALLREHPEHPVYGRLRPDAEARARTLYESQLRSTAEVILLAEQDGEAVGILRCVDAPASPLFEPERYGYVSSVYVLPRLRRRGVLRALLRDAERWCRARGLTEMRLHNVPGGDAEATWSSLGFTLVEQVRLRPL